MDPNQLADAFRRHTRFEVGRISEVDELGGYQVQQGNRSSPSSGFGKIRGDQFHAGERVIMVNGAILGHNPWICE